jgi:hypothetical protein
MQGRTLAQESFDHFDQMENVWEAGTTTDTIPGGYGEFGLTLSNPIPMICISSSDRYLKKLRYNGKPVDSKRLGSTSSDVTSGSVDIYELRQGGSELCAIYICPYHKKDSKLAPKRFTLSNDAA